MATIKNKTVFSQMQAASKSPFCIHHQPKHEKRQLSATDKVQRKPVL